MSIYSKTAAGWVEVAGGASKAALSSWGRVVGEPTGAVTSTYFNNDDGSQWQYWEFNSPDDYEIDLGNGGLFWVLAVGGGDGGDGNDSNHYQHGQPGLVREGLWEFGPGTHTVTVGTQGEKNVLVFGQPSFIDDVLTGFSTQGLSTWGDTSTGRGVGGGGNGYKSRITGDLLEYGTGYAGTDRPGRGGLNSGEQRDGCVVIATRIDVEQLAPAPAELAPAPVLGAPVKVSGSSDVLEYIVRQTDGTRKKIYMLPGNTAGGDENVFEVTLGAGVLPGVMVASGGPGGGLSGSPTFRPGAGGAGGVIGQGAHVPVILPVQGTATYTISVPSTAIGGDWKVSGDSCTIAVQGQEPFMAAVGGGVGCKMNSASWPAIASVGGSGGGGSSYKTEDAFGIGAAGVPGQGHKGGDGTTQGTTYGGGGGGYSSPGNEQLGGTGFDLATALNLDANDGLTGTFLDLVSDGGVIASGGTTIGNATPGGGGVGAGGHAKDFTGSGGGGDNGNGGNGGAGAVYIITDV